MSAAARITFFNHKSGVGKTTLAANVAFALAAKGKSVLLVDSDPQCDLTSYLLPDRMVEELLTESDGPHGRTIWSALKPVYDGGRAGRLVDPLPVGDIALVPGDIRLASLEAFLNDSWAGCLRRRLSALYATSSLSALVSRLEAQCGYDYVLFDTGSNLGPLNRVLLLGSDYFIVPVVCDRLSVLALASLGQAMGAWMEDADTFNAIAPDDIPLLRAKPALLGYILQRFGVREQAVTKGAAPHVREISGRIRHDVVSVLCRHGGSLVQAHADDPRIGQVEDLAPLVPVAWQESVPLWECSDGTPRQRRVARCNFVHIANSLDEAVGEHR